MDLEGTYILVAFGVASSHMHTLSLQNCKGATFQNPQRFTFDVMWTPLSALRIMYRSEVRRAEAQDPYITGDVIVDENYVYTFLLGICEKVNLKLTQTCIIDVL